MRKICLNHKDGSKVVVFDESDVDIDEYCVSLSQIFTMSNVSILKTTGDNVILRPSCIQSILVQEEKDIEPVVEETLPPPKEKTKIIEDVITDK